MEKLLDDALRIVHSFSDEPGMYLYFQHCHGIVLLSAYEASCIFSAQGGTGVLLRHDKKNNKWSPPCAIGLGGVGVGIQAGVEKKDIVMFLTEKSMVKTLAGEFQLRIGSKIGLTLGPEGEEDDFYAHFSNRGVASTSSFAHTKGVSFGISMEGGIIMPRFKTNTEYFGSDGDGEEEDEEKKGMGPSPKKILFGQVSVPAESKLAELHHLLDEASVKKKDRKIEYKDTIPSPFLNKPHVNKIE